MTSYVAGTQHVATYIRTALQLAVIFDVIGSLMSSRVAHAGTRCSFPRDWQGRYFQGGLGEVFIRDNFMTSKGHCVDQNRDYFLFNNRESNCYHCLLILRRHKNIIQYKEGYCTSGGSNAPPTLKSICSQIQVEQPLYTLVRDPSTPVRCPFQGAFHFAYNDLVSGFCDDVTPSSELSYARPCVGQTRYQLKFNHCVQSATFHGLGVEMECLATWKDGSENYLYSKLARSPQLNGKDEQFRCFKYQQYGSEMSLAMSVDATCNGLRSATDGPFLLKLNKDTFGWPSPTCQFPDWLRGVTWHDLTRQSRYTTTENGDTLSHHKVKTAKSKQQTQLISEFQCLHSLRAGSDEFYILSLTHANCSAKRQCIKLQRLSNNAIQLQQGRWLEKDSYERCNSDSYSNGVVLIADNATTDLCPRPGVHHTSAVNGCLHRVSVGCTNITSLVIDSSCPTARFSASMPTYSCVTSWQVAKKHYVVVRPTSQQSNSDEDHAFRCFSFLQRGNVTIFAADAACSSSDVTNTSLPPAADVYQLVRHETCRSELTPSRDVVENKRRTSLSTPSPSRSRAFTLSPTRQSTEVSVSVRRHELDEDAEGDDVRDFSGDREELRGHYRVITLAAPGSSERSAHVGLPVVKSRSSSNHEIGDVFWHSASAKVSTQWIFTTTLFLTTLSVIRITT